MMKSWEFYVFYFIVVVLFLYKGMSKKNKYFRYLYIAISYIIYIYVAVNRPIGIENIDGNVYTFGGADAYIYSNYFYNADMPLSIYLNTYHGEIGFNSVLWIVYQLFGDFKYFLFGYHTLIYVLFYFLLKKEIFASLTKIRYFDILLLSIFLFTSFNTMRNDLAIIIWMISFHYLKRGSYFRALVILFIALLIHSASIIGLPVIIIRYIFDLWKQNNKTRLLIWIPICISSFYFGTRFVLYNYLSNSEYSLYLNDSGLAINTYLYIFIIIIITIIKNDRIVNRIQGYKSYIAYLVVNLSIVAIQSQFFMAYRMILFFLGINYIYSYELLDKVLDAKTWTNILFKIVIYLYFLYRIYDLFFVQINASGLFRIS